MNSFFFFLSELIVNRILIVFFNKIVYYLKLLLLLLLLLLLSSSSLLLLLSSSLSLLLSSSFFFRLVVTLFQSACSSFSSVFFRGCLLKDSIFTSWWSEYLIPAEEGNYTTCLLDGVKSIIINNCFIIHSKHFLFKNLFMLSVRISSYGCTREVWRARKMRKSCTRR